jgi:hypothetical protein
LDLRQSFPGFTDNAGDRFAGLCSFTHPLIHLGEVEEVIHPILERILGAHLINEGSIPAAAGVCDHDTIIRTVLGTFAPESDCDHDDLK